jgi:hypothetical protein
VEGICQALCVDFFADNRYIKCALVSFSSEKQAKEAFKYFSREEQRGNLWGILHDASGAEMESSVRWFKNKALDPSNQWIGIVIRGLKRDITKEKLKSMLGDSVLHIEIPRLVNGATCTLITVKHLEAALHLIAKLNAHHLRTFLHPSSHILKKPELAKDYIYPNRKRPRSNSGTPGGYKQPKLTEAVEKLLSLVKKSPESAPVVQKESTGSEDGEINEAGKAPSENENQECYKVYEFPGIYATKYGQFSHEGVNIKTQLLTSDEV